MADCYLLPDQQTSFLDPDSGLVRQIQKTGNIVNRFMAPETVAEFQDAVNNYNEALNVHVHSKVVAEQQDNWSEIPGEVVKCQCFIVSGYVEHSDPDYIWASRFTCIY